MIHVLVIEDDTQLQKLFCTVLNEHGYTTSGATDGFEAFDILDTTHIDLVISDVMMPNMDGIEFVTELRGANYNMPVLMITAKGGLSDKQKGFSSGIDDYMVKPIDINEMLWRVEALLRRSQIINLHKTIIGSTQFDRDTLTVTTGDLVLELVQKEFFLLFKLASSPNKIFTRRQIMDEIWGVDTDSDSHTLDVHISRLRERFKSNEDFEIITVRGLGYKLVRKEMQ